MPKIRQEINLTNVERSGVSVVQPEAAYVDPSDYNGKTVYFEAVVKNDNAGQLNLRLYASDNVGDADYNVVNIIVPASTAVWTRLRSNSFTLHATYFYYQVAPAHADLYYKSAKIIILQDATDITATQTQIEIGSYMLKTSSPSEDVYMGVDEPKYWKYESAKWDPTPTFKFGITVANETAGKTNNVGIQEDDGAGGWTATPVITITGISSEDPTYYESSSFTPTNGKIYRLAWMTPNDKYALTIYNAKIIATSYIANEFGAYANYETIRGGGVDEAKGMAFTNGLANDLIAVDFNLIKNNSPTGNIEARLYASTGTVGTNAVPTGAALATSSAIDVSTLTTREWVTFTFPSPYSMLADTDYCVSLVYEDGTATDNVRCSWVSPNDNRYNAFETDDISSPSWASFQYNFMFKAKTAITKLQPEYLLINDAQTDTGLQEFQTYFDPAEWDGVSNNYYHEHSANSASSNTKLQEDPGGTPADITNSNITGNNLTRGGSAMTMPATAKEIDSYIVTA